MRNSGSLHAGSGAGHARREAARMNNSRKSILSGIAGMVLILVAVRNALSSFDGMLLIVGVILLAIGAAIADRDRELKMDVDRRDRLRELHSAIDPGIEDENERA